MLPTYRVESIGTDNNSTTILIKLETFEQCDQEKFIAYVLPYLCLRWFEKTSVVKVKHSVSIFIALRNMKYIIS